MDNTKNGQHKEWTTQRMDNTKNGQHKEWTTQRMDNTKNGQHKEWTTQRMDSTKNGQHKEWTTQRMDNTKNGQHKEWTTQRMDNTKHRQLSYSYYMYMWQYNITLITAYNVQCMMIQCTDTSIFYDTDIIIIIIIIMFRHYLSKNEISIKSVWQIILIICGNNGHFITCNRICAVHTI